MCLGTLRTPLSRRTSSDIRLILLTPRAPSTEQECRDIRLRLGAELYDIVEGTDMSDVINFEGIEPWFLARKESLEEINRVQRILLPLPSKSHYTPTFFKLKSCAKLLRIMSEPISKLCLSSSVCPGFSFCIALLSRRGCLRSTQNSFLWDSSMFECMISRFWYQ